MARAVGRLGLCEQHCQLCVFVVTAYAPKLCSLHPEGGLLHPTGCPVLCSPLDHYPCCIYTPGLGHTLAWQVGCVVLPRCCPITHTAGE